MRVGANRPGRWRTVPDPPEDVRGATESEREGCLRLLDHWGAMDVAPMLGLVEEPPARPPARGITRKCRCGDCRNCNQSKPWACPDCAATVQWGSRKRHRTSVHGWVPDE